MAQSTVATALRTTYHLRQCRICVNWRGVVGWPAHSSGLETDSIVNNSMPRHGVLRFKPQPQRLWLEYAEGPRPDSLGGAACLALKDSSRYGQDV